MYWLGIKYAVHHAVGLPVLTVVDVVRHLINKQPELAGRVVEGVVIKETAHKIGHCAVEQLN